MHNRKFIAVMSFMMLLMSAMASFAAAVYDTEEYSTSFDADVQAYFESQGYDTSIGDYIVSGDAGVWSATEDSGDAFLTSYNRAVVRTLPKVKITGSDAPETADYVMKVRYVIPLNTNTQVISGDSLLKFYPDGLTVISGDGNTYAQATGTASFLDATGRAELTDAMVMQIAGGELGTAAGDGVTQYYDGYIVMTLARQEDGDDAYRPVIVVKMTKAAGGGVAINEENFPDNTFRSYVSSYFDSDKDGMLSEEEAAAVTSMSVQGKGISSLQGVEYFTALTDLSCSSNKLTALDVSRNTALTQLNCEENQLISLDVSSNTALTTLYCYSNPLTSLNVRNATSLTVLWCTGCWLLTSLDVSNNTTLTRLGCYSSPLTYLNLSNATALTELYCYDTQLTSLDVSSNTALTTLSCYKSQLTALDVSNNTALTHLDCANNQLTAIDVSNNTALTELNCSNNQLTALDVSKNTALTDLRCHENQLTALDVTNQNDLRELYCDSQILAVSLDATGLADSPYSLSFSALNPALDISSVDNLAVLDSSNSSVNYSADIDAGKWYFASQPSTMTYIYNTGYSGTSDNASMDVTVTFSGVVSVPEKPKINTTVIPDAIAGEYYSVTFTASGTEPLYWDISSDKGFGGFSFDKDTGTLSGTSIMTEKEHKITFTVSVSNDYGVVSKKFVLRVIIPPTITDTELPDGYVGRYYSADVKFIGSKTITYTADNLPDWLTLNTDTDNLSDDEDFHLLSGTPAAGKYTFTITASNTAGQDSAEFTITIHDAQPEISSDTFPDSALRDYLASKVDSDGDGYLSDEEIASVTSLDISGLGISDLTGIEIFTALTHLDCSSNDLTTLSVSAFTNLEWLICQNNQLSALDVSQNTALIALHCDNNYLEAIDVSSNSLLHSSHVRTTESRPLTCPQTQN